MPVKVHLDVESFSECNLKKAGMYRYAEHESTEVLLACYSFDDSPVHLWVPWGAEEWQWDEFPLELEAQLVEFMRDHGELYIQPRCPGELAEHVAKGGELRAHNAGFERTMLNGNPGKKIGFPHIEIGQCVCTAAKAAAHSLPRSLENVTAALGTYGKDRAGKIDMLAFCKPRVGKIPRYTPQNAPDRFFRVCKYCVDDVLAERGVDYAVPDLSKKEQKVWELDQLINDRGIKADLPRVADVQVLIAQYKSFLENQCKKLTGVNPSQTEKLGNWIRANGYPIENLQAPTMKEALKDKHCPAEVTKVISIRLLHSMKAVSKYTAIENAACSDSRLHGMFLYHGAKTARWASMIVQLQNLFRPVIDDPEVAIEAFKARDLAWIKALYSEDPMKVFASCVRGMLIPEEGHDLLAMDFSSIEARMLAWFAGQEDILEVFRGHGKIYEHTASKIYKITVEKVDKNQRFIGKIATLALGYQGGRKAFAKMAKNYGVDIPEEQAEQIKIDWRKANVKIVRLWYELEEVAIHAVKNPGTAFALRNKKVIFKVAGEFLHMRLPSGRRMAYYKPRIDDEQLTFLGVDTYSRRWKRCNTYGGSLAENLSQSASRDLLVNGMFHLEDAGYPVIGTVHDEVILEIPENFGSEKEVAELMCKIPDWAEGLPVKAEGFRAKRYRK